MRQSSGLPLSLYDILLVLIFYFIAANLFKADQLYQSASFMPDWELVGEKPGYPCAIILFSENRFDGRWYLDFNNFIAFNTIDELTNLCKPDEEVYLIMDGITDPNHFANIHLLMMKRTHVNWVIKKELVYEK